MGKVVQNLTELIGDTPMLKLNNYMMTISSNSNIFGKLENLNPLNSVKDRVALGIIEDAKSRGHIDENTVIIEASGGNSSIALAFVCASKGYKLILIMPEIINTERISLLKALGAEVILTPSFMGMKGAVIKAEELSKSIKNSFLMRQFENKINPTIHYNTTGKEIYEEMDGKIDYLVSGIGTGGTISGVGKYLKEKIPNIKIIGFEPKDSAVLSGQKPGNHRLYGIGAGFVPCILDTNIYDEIYTVTTEEAVKSSKEVARTEGLIVGITSGAALSVASKISKDINNKDANIVAIFPDTGERYLINRLYD